MGGFSTMYTTPKGEQAGAPRRDLIGETEAEAAAARAQRGRDGMVATSLRGVLTPPTGLLKSLLGE
ncbi:MAG: hypothetical protein ACM33T_01720 [Solirubrobacterales bacterium]